MDNKLLSCQILNLCICQRLELAISMRSKGHRDTKIFFSLESLLNHWQGRTGTHLLILMEIPALRPDGERTGTTDLNAFWCQIFIPLILPMSIMVTEPSMTGILVPLVNISLPLCCWPLCLHPCGPACGLIANKRILLLTSSSGGQLPGEFQLFHQLSLSTFIQCCFIYTLWKLPIALSCLITLP